MVRPIGLSLILGLLLASCNSLPSDGTGGSGPGPVSGLYPSQDYSVAVNFGAAPVNAPSQGQWSQLVDAWPTLAIHTTLLPNGQVMTFGGNYYPNFSDYAGKTDVKYPNKIDLWDPATNNHQTITYVGSALFCGGHTLLPDGRVLVAGGDDLSKLTRFRSAEAGTQNTNIYDYKTKSWSKAAAMSEKRWYPTTTTLPNGDVLAVAGNTTGSGTFATTPEVYNPASNQWRRLDGATAETDFYPWLFVASNGQVFNAGPDKDEVGWINTAGAGSWRQDAPAQHLRRDYGTAVMYDQDKVLVLGGGGSDERDNADDLNNDGRIDNPAGTYVSPTADATDIDISGGTAKYTTLQPMHFRRRFHTSTLLADGTVLITGGTQAYGFNNAKYPPNDPVNGAKAGQDATVKVPELWDPATKTFTTLAPMQIERLYHSTALLLPDATVLVSGGGACTAGNPAYSGCPDESQPNAGYDKFRNAEVFKPPYLFKGPRPSIQGVSSATIRYGQTFQVSTADAAGITAVNLIRLGSVTHAFNMNQRISRLTFSKNNGALSVTAPANANFAPPGQYMLFILRNGVPSVARILTVTN